MCAVTAAMCLRRHPFTRAVASTRGRVDSAGAIAEAPDWLLARITERTNGNGEATPPAEWRAAGAAGVDEGAARLHRRQD